jgi:hypothetical protein
LAVALVMVVAGGVAVLWWTQSSNPPKLAAPPVGRSTDPGDAHAATTALTHLATDPNSLVAARSKKLVGAKARAALPSGSTVAVDKGSWRPDGVGGGTLLVTVRPPAGAAVTYVAVMVREPDGWKVLTTVPLTGGGQ